MKILSVCTSTPGEDAANWRISNISRILESKGHEVHFVHYCRKLSYEKLENKGQYSNRTFIITSAPAVHIEHLKILLKNNYDMAYGNNYDAAFCSLLTKLTKISLIFDMHGDIVEEFLIEKGPNLSTKISPKFLLNKFIDFMDLKFSDKIICVSKKMIEYLHDQKSIPLEKMAYVTNGVDLESFKPVNDEKIKNMRNQLGLKDKLVFGYVGNFQKWQGVKNFIEAAKKINDKDLAFLIVGGDKELRENNIIYIPKIPRSQIPMYYSICNVLVLPRPSHLATEIAAPTKFAEYTAMEKPILTTDVGDAADFVTEYKCGIVVKDNKPENLIKGTNEFKGKTEEELKRMGRNSRKLAESEFDWGKVGINLLKAVESLR
uniref:D-inositol-3-phosphate glycosyltransferase n=1 Tax=Candidatus Methanophaga sp. ANME-1 ERB7 TaxID=2759913 RepID=A0A7G9Z449_9EURY|nr:D-inositol-3-phosphate glycosyltransferase [Methanosarcinales archaeon ANME-1 ERB7]QNO55104.1 D-inositol-3-phosphate glycosyltransferase [Methanosarcinales archaeon ANME-1 ERB7]